jgi:DNA-binding CsgD family transcriptional regulator
VDASTLADRSAVDEPGTPGRADGAEPLLRGRAPQLEAIRRSLGSLSGGRGHVVVLRGATGAGTTRMLAEARRAAAVQGIPHWSEPCADRPSLDPDQPFAALRSLRTQLEAAATRAPLLLTIDDLPLVGRGTHLALRTLPAHLADLPVLWVVGGGAPDTSGAAATTVARLVGGGAQVLDLPAVPPTVVRALAHDVLGPRAASWPLQVAERAGGRPGLVVDLLRRLRAEIDDRAGADDGPGPVGAPPAVSGRWGPALDPTDDPQLVRCALRAGQRERARRVVATTEARARAHPRDPVVLAAHAHAVGLLDGDPDELVRAVSLLDAERRPFAHASALEDAARAVDDRDRAVAMFETAMRVYDRAGAPRDAARVRARLRELGVHRRRAVRPASGFGWTSLTPTEIEVVRLVCRGATNRQAATALYLSPHTVSSHLRHAFAKLDISSRVELTRIALAHDDAGTTRPAVPRSRRPRS